MKLFITGVAGFLGSNLANFYLKRGFDVIGNDTLTGGYKDNIPNGVKFYEVPCEDFKELKKLLSGVDVVIHTAAYAHEGL